MDLSILPSLPLCTCDIRVSGIALTEDELRAGNSPFHGRERLHTLWRASRSPVERPFYIVTFGNRTLELGDQDLYLSPLPDLDFLKGEGTPGHFELPALLEICKEQGIAVKAPSEDERGKTVQVLREPGELVDELEKLHEETSGAIFYKRVPPYPLEVVLELKEDLTSALETSLRGGWKVDPDVLLAFKAHIPVVDPTAIPSNIAMRHSPNAILTTGTKAGKSSIGRRVGRLVERPTVAGMLGFADSEKSHPGI
ncbi:MAG: hypothetical protein ACE5JL_11920, partial [Dehalococcoidia bacterium]